MTAVEYIQLRAARADLITRVAMRTSGFDALLMPTVAITAPPIAAFASVINFLDGCAITVPVQTLSPPVGLMIVGEHDVDRHLLTVGRGIEAALNRIR
jgi:aspartyl-tRNA(Asn)/glutamyl-tRNA(Gln) amidotransferase subunit A